MTGLKNPVETTLGVLMVLDEIREKMKGTELATFNWRPSSPEMSNRLTDLALPALMRVSDNTEALIVIAMAALKAAQEEKENMK